MQNYVAYKSGHMQQPNSLKSTEKPLVHKFSKNLLQVTVGKRQQKRCPVSSSAGNVSLCPRTAMLETFAQEKFVISPGVVTSDVSNAEGTITMQFCIVLMHGKHG